MSSIYHYTGICNYVCVKQVYLVSNCEIFTTG